jgi:hypothetical protein
MQKSIITVVNSLKGLLLKTPELTNAFQEKKHTALPTLDIWLKNLEQELKKFNYAQCAEIAGLRSQLIEIKYDPEQNRLHRKKRLFSKGSSVIYPAQSVVQEVIHPLEEKINQARQLIQQVLSIALQAKIIKKPTSAAESLGYIQNIWVLLKNNTQLNAGLQNIISLVGSSDGMRLLAEEIYFD